MTPRLPGTAWSRRTTRFQLEGTRQAYVLGLFLGGYAATIGVRVSFLGFHLPTILFLCAVAYALLEIPISRWLSLRITIVDYAASAYVIARVGLELYNSISLGHSPSLSMAGNTVYYLIAYLIARAAVRTREGLRAFLGAVITWGFLVSVVAIAQILGFRSLTRTLLSITSSDGAASRLADGRLTRATSLIGHWSALGGYLVCILACIAIALILDRSSSSAKPLPGLFTCSRRFLLLSFAVVFVAIISTFTLAPILAAFAVAAVLALVLGIRISIVVLSALFSGLVWFMFRGSIESRIAVQSRYTTYLSDEYSWVPSTLAVRLSLWINESFPAFRERPWTGWGQSVFGKSREWGVRPVSIIWPYPESEVAKALVTTGLLGFAALLILLMLWLRQTRRVTPILGSQVSAVATTLMVVLCVASVINPYFTNQGVPSILWPMMGALTFASIRDATTKGYKGKETI